MKSLALLLIGLASTATGQDSCYWVNGVKICPTSGQPISPPAMQQPIASQPVEQLIAITEPEIFEVSVEVADRDGGTSVGNGVVLSCCYGGGSVVVTNAHVVRDIRDPAAVTVAGADGTLSRGYVLAAEEETDLAAIRVGADWAPAPLATSADVGASAQIRGYHAGRFKKTFGPVSRPHNYGYWVGCRVPDGMSGSGAYQRGRLVGIVFGSDGRESSISGVGPIRRLLRRVLGHEPIGPTAARSRPAPVPGTQQPVTFPAQPTTYATAPTSTASTLPAELDATLPTTQSPTQNTPASPPCDCPEKFARLQTWQQQTDATLAEIAQRIDHQDSRTSSNSELLEREIKQQDSTLRGWVREQLRDKIGDRVKERVEDKAPSVATGAKTAAKVYAWTQYIGPAGGIVAAAAGLWAIWSSRRQRRETPTSTPADGRGGPSAGEF